MFGNLTLWSLNLEFNLDSLLAASLIVDKGSDWKNSSSIGAFLLLILSSTLLPKLSCDLIGYS
jgi:hypothetical protein